MSQPRVAIVGAGPAGLSAAAAAARAGAAAVVFDERPWPGGQLLYRVQPVDCEEGIPAETPRVLLERLRDDAVSAGAELHVDTLVAGVFPGNELFLVEGDRGSRTEADALIVATGSTDLPYPFAGATFPGVLSGRALQILMNQWRIRPGRRFAIIGAGATADELAVDIMLAGGEIVWSGVAPAPFLQAQGRDGVHELVVGEERVETDIIAIAVGRQPDAALAAIAGAPLGFVPSLGGFVPIVGANLETNQPRLFVAGDAAGVGSVAASIAEGRLAGVAAAASLGLVDSAEVEAARVRGGDEVAWRAGERARVEMTFQQPFV